MAERVWFMTKQNVFINLDHVVSALYTWTDDGDILQIEVRDILNTTHTIEASQAQEFDSFINDHAKNNIT